MKKCGDKMDFHKKTQRIARRLHTLKWMTDVMMHPGRGKAETDKLVLFDTAINSQNMGDSIIAYYCTKALSEIIAGKDYSEGGIDRCAFFKNQERARGTQ